MLIRTLILIFIIVIAIGAENKEYTDEDVKEF